MADDRLLPEDWSIVKLGELATLVSGGTPSKGRPEYWQGTIPWASPKDMKRQRLYDAEDHISPEGLEAGSRLVPEGSIFIVVRGMILSRDLPVSMAMVPMAFNQDMKAILPNDRVDADYLLYALIGHKTQLIPEIGTSAHGTRRVGTSSITDFRLPLPPREEQVAIASVLHTVQQTIAATEKVIASTRQLKQSLMRHLFTYGPVPYGLADQVQVKESEIGQMPQHWKINKLGSLARFSSGGTPSREKPEYWDGGIPWVKTGEVNYTSISSTEETISCIGLENSSARLLPPGTLLIAMYGQSVTRGRVGILGIEAATNQACAAILPSEVLDTGFLYHVFVSALCQN